MIFLSIFESELLQAYKDEEPIYTIFISEQRMTTTPPSYSDPVLELMNQFGDVLPNELPKHLSPTRTIQHQVDLILGSTLPNFLHYRLNLKVQQVLESIIEDLLRKKLIQPSLCPRAVATLIVPKQDEKWILCVDS